MQIKVNTSEIDCWNTDEIVCPYCGAVHGDSWEFGKGEDIGEMNCDYCGREFIATRNIETTYSSRPAGTKPYIDWEEGDIFDDGIAEDEAEKWANQNGEKPCEVVEQVHSWSEDYDGNVHILGREQKMKPIKKPCPYCDETPEPMIKKNGFKLSLDEDGDIFIEVDLGCGTPARAYKTVNYCPMCGRRLER